ncbi:MAG: cell division protein FtsA [Candidatus Azobacteroides sp.]|nr:cell division protein FtsA [Candidatus Azobacteroides sp.]
MHKEIIATLDIGSFKIVAAAGKKDDKGIVSVSAMETEMSNSSVRRGRIYNVDEVSNKIKSLIDRLNHQLNEKVSKIYVGISGQSLKTEVYPVVEETGGVIVDELLLLSLRQQCEAYHPDFSEVLDIVSPEYFLNGEPEKNPIGVFCNKIEARFQLVLGNPSIKSKLKTCITEKNNIEIAGYLIGPIATARAILTESEKISGCALIEFGAGLTYLSIYKDGLLKYLASIPLGGNVITKDICSLHIPENEAEDLKITYGNALVETPNENNAIKNIKLQDNRDIELEVLNDIIESRTEEIIANVKNLLELSGFSDSIRSGIVITGGMAALKNLAESVKEKINPKVRLAHVKDNLVDEGSSTFGQTFGNEATIGLLSLGTENCIHVKEIEKIPTPPQTSLFSEEEVVVIKPNTNKKEGGTGKRKLPSDDQKEERGTGLFHRLTQKAAKKVDQVSRGLFESVDSTTDDNETEEEM